MKIAFSILLVVIVTASADIKRSCTFGFLGTNGGIGANAEYDFNHVRIKGGLSTAIFALGLPFGIDYYCGNENQFILGIGMTPGTLLIFDPSWFIGISGNIAYRKMVKTSSFFQISYNPTYFRFLDNSISEREYYMIPWFGISYGWYL